ncbi:LOW QUALITY PROTEIN: interferon-induced very large GTPase 1-like [Lampetra fluviatilis]
MHETMEIRRTAPRSAHRWLTVLDASPATWLMARVPSATQPGSAPALLASDWTGAHHVPDWQTGCYNLQCPFSASNRHYALQWHTSTALLAISGEEDEERSSQAHDDLARMLRDVGLDEVYWKQKLREVLLISSAQTLLHLDRQECKELDSHFRKSWEKKAFYKMIAIDADDVVSDKEEMSLARIQNDNPLPPVVSERMNEPTQMSNSVSRHCRSDEEILRNASGGLALEGVYMSGKLEDTLEKRGKLLTIPQTIQFVDPVHTPMTQQHEFISFSEESVFEKGMKVMGFSSTVSEQGCVSTLSREPISMPNKSLNLKKMQNVQTDHSHISRTEYTYLPLASAHLQMAQIRLSDAALKELQNIENTLENTKADFKSAVLTSMIRNFFHLFGSHANEGPLEFGGIFWRKASAQGFSLDQQDEMKRLLSELLGSTIGADCDSRTTTDTGAAMTTEPASSSSGQHGPVLTDMVKMTVTTIGGDPDVHDLPQWKAAVVSNNRTWSLIDRGIRFIPVWDIVLSNHRCDFKDVLKVASDLITAYAILTNKHANNYQDDALAATIVEAQSIMQDVRQWMISHLQEWMISDDITHLDKLGNLKQKFYECTQTNRSWIDACLSHPALQEYLNLAVSTCKHSSRDEPKQLKMKIQRLLEPNIYAVDNFPQRSSITQWVYGTDTVKIRDAELKALADTFTETKKRLKRVTDSPTYSETALNVAKVKGTNDVTFSLNSLCRCLREMTQVQEEELFIAAAAASGFSATERLFHRLLDYEDVDCLQHEVDRAHSEYSALKHLTFMKSLSNANICPKVSNVVQVHDGSPIHCEQTEERFKSLVSGTALATLAISPTREVERKTNGTERFMNLLERLNLQKYYPKQMHIEYVSVKSAMHAKNTSTEQELASYFLQKLIMGDYEARYVSVQSENKCNEAMNNNANSNYEAFFKHDDTLSRREGLTTNTQTHIHPMDLQMTIYHCGDNFVRQYLYTKLSFCQFALPLLVPNPHSSEIELPLWAFQQINKNWKCRDTSTNTLQTKSCAIVNADTPLVSFIRFGESPTSKSQMLNSLLSKQRHDIFFHRHCKGSSRNGLLMEGVTEVAWYCPGGRDDDVFNDCIAFTNLHGDARRHRKQVQFLHEISSINVILMSDRDHNDEAKIILQECLTSPKPFVCLCADQERIEGGNSGAKVKIAVKNRNEADFMHELKSTLNSLLRNITQINNLDNCPDIARRYDFIVDEDDEHCKDGKSMADVLLCILNDQPLSSMKETFLPLQGKLWHEWCKKDKELARFRLQVNQSIEEYRDNISMEKRSIRRSQLLEAFPLNDVMTSLIDILQHQPDTVKKYFLHWLKIHLDRLSAECLSKLHLQYQQAWTRSIKSKGTESSLLANKQEELDEVCVKIGASFFGIDHIFREVGQIYEASQTLDGTDQRSAALPGIAADLMLSGFPLELMDGDASHVPLSWISSVLDKVIQKIGDKTLFVLSILGIQSSGKSTLLNAMFGLQFPVGAGRCTRGVYMQLVKVEEELTKELGFDFVLIVDTEGLRAPELSNATPTHDNELATFVIGLGNATVINMFGENPSEMQDILQIAVQAFLRMKRVKLSPSCVFVHQNVGDVTAQDKNMEGRRRLKKKLDEMTRLAAQQEQCDVDSFDEVIRCDVASHIHYFAHLWEGNPPMAPPNPSYCQNVQDLKRMLLDIAKRERNVLKISEFKARIQDLWTALLAENFVFSFKNTLEIAAYNKLEEMYVKWTWSLRSYLIQEENKQHNIINNRTDTTYDLTRSSVEQTVYPKYNEISKQIETHFNADNTELLSQWKANFVKRFETIKDELVTDTYKKCTDLMKQKSARIKLDQNRSRYENQLMKKSKDLASKLKTTERNDIRLEKEFDQMWEEWTDEVKKTLPHLEKWILDNMHKKH